MVLEAEFAVTPGAREVEQAEVSSIVRWRREHQPGGSNAGSVFTNPPGDSAGRLIEQAGLKGHTLGRAQISSLHANWIVNLGGATARDVVALMELAQVRVRDAFGAELQPEVRRIGRFL